VPPLFVGIDFPLELKLSLSTSARGLPGAKWVEPCKFHLTQRFIGTVDDPTATNINAVLLRIEAACFMLSLAGVGHFGGHTLWVGVEKNPALICLQGRIENRLQLAGLAPDDRPYVPHVKLAHLRRRRSLRAFLTQNADFSRRPRSGQMLQPH
jgi:2'-5' RNA ligase